MISPKAASILSHMPKGLYNFIARKIVKKYLDEYANIKVENKEKLDNIKAPVIFICNHLSNADGLVLSRVLKDHDVTFVAGVKLSNNALTNIGVSIVKTTPVHPNSPDKEGIKKILEIIKGGNNILIFPEGTRSRTGKMIEGKKGVILIARMCKVPIVPIGITGTEKLMPINMEGKMEEERFYHADVNIKIGDAFELPKRLEGEPKKEYEERAMKIIMGSIAELLPQEYRGDNI